MVPTYCEDSLNARPTRCGPSEAAKWSVTRPLTSLPKSKVTADPVPLNRVDLPESTAELSVTEPTVLWIATGFSVRDCGE